MQNYLQNYEVINNTWIRQRFDTHYRVIKIAAIFFIEAMYPSIESSGMIRLYGEQGLALSFMYPHNTKGEEAYDADLAFFERLIFDNDEK